MAASSHCLRVAFALALACMAATLAAHAADIGRIKVANGEVTIERDGRRVPAAVGMAVQGRDVVRTGGDGSVGISMSDNALLSAGPNSVLALEQYEFDETSGKGRFDASLTKGSLAVVSGRIAKQSPDAMTVRTPFAVLAVRGTEFAVTAHEPMLALP
jgi:hypothetical protein